MRQWLMCLWPLLLVAWQAAVYVRGRQRLKRQRAAEPPQQEPRETGSAERSAEQVAVALFDNRWPEAVAAADMGLELVERGTSTHAELLLHRGEALEHMGRLEEAVAAYSACQPAEGNRSRPQFRHVAALRQGLLLVRLGRLEEAQDRLCQGIEWASDATNVVVAKQLEALDVVAMICAKLSDRDHAAHCVRRGLQIARGLMAEAQEARLLQVQGDVCAATGQNEAALRNYEHSLDLFRKLDHEAGQAAVEGAIGKLFQVSGQWEKATYWLQASVLEEQQRQNIRGQATLCYDLACLYLDQGAMHEAGAFLQRSVALYRESGDTAGVDRVGRTMVGLAVLIHRYVASGRMTYRDIERGSGKSKKEDEEEQD